MKKNPRRRKTRKLKLARTRRPLTGFSDKPREHAGIVKYGSHNQELLVNGQEYIVVSNEPNPYYIGRFIGFHKYPRFQMPVFVNVDTSEEFLSGGIVIDNTSENRELLAGLMPIEQWNILAHSHCQIGEKYGIRYRKFPCKCESCQVSS